VTGPVPGGVVPGPVPGGAVPLAPLDPAPGSGDRTSRAATWALSLTLAGLSGYVALIVASEIVAGLTGPEPQESYRTYLAARLYDAGGWFDTGIAALLLGSVAVTWWLWRAGPRRAPGTAMPWPTPPGRSVQRLATWEAVLFVLAVPSAIARSTGLILEYTVSGVFFGYRWASGIGAVADLVLNLLLAAAGLVGLAALRREFATVAIAVTAGPAEPAGPGWAVGSAGYPTSVLPPLGPAAVSGEPAGPPAGPQDAGPDR
jgi:hypothetical protein